MRKILKKFALVLFCCLVLTGCGHKSEEELTDIEQFRCQDSIQTVFDVLGETELETGMFGGDYYKYESLNLWGYNGEALFAVRDDKKTIRDFYCNLQLDKKEFQDVLSQLESKYGEYEKHDYSSQTSYVWEIPEDSWEEKGYSQISFVDYGDKKFVVKFSDEWSMYKDEAYYKHLEEEKEIKVLAQKTYNIGDDTFDFSFGKRGNGDYSFALLCRIENKSDAYMAHISLNALFNSDEEALKVTTETMNFTYSIIVGDGTVLLRSKDVLYLTKNGEMIGVNDYFSVDWILNDEEKNWDYGTKVINFLVDFMQNE